MKIKYDMWDNYYKCYNEALGIASNKRSVLKGAKVFDYLSYGYLYLLIAIILIIISYFLYNFYGICLYTKFLFFLDAWLILMVFIYFIYFFLRANSFWKTKAKGYIELSTQGIINTQFMGIKMIFAWKKIEAVVIGKRTIVIFTDTPIYFFLNSDNQESIIKALKSYKRNLKIIELKNSKKVSKQF